MAKIPQISKIEQIQKLKNDKIFAMMMGQYKNYRVYSKELAKLSFDDFDSFMRAKPMPVKNIPLFSKVGFRTLKVAFLNMFSKKTKEEKALIAKLKEEKLKEYLKKK